MKSMTKGIIGVLVLTVVMIGAAWAAETTEEKNLSKEATQIDKTAGSSQGQKVVVDRLVKEFGVTDQQIQGLRNQKMSYGEISIVFSLASKMPGGITDSNIQQIMQWRQGPPKMGWGEIANKKIGTKLGPTISQVKNMNAETHREMREANTNKGSEEKSEGGNTEHHGETMGHEGMGGTGGGEGMSNGKGR
jgi:hypothetical protein